MQSSETDLRNVRCWFISELMADTPCIMSVQYTGGLQYTGGCSVHRGYSVHRRMFSTPENIIEYTGGCSIHLGNIVSTPGDIMISVTGGHRENNWICMETPVYWTSPGVLMISPTLIMVSPVYWTPPLYSWYPPVYWTSPCILHRHYAGW